MFGTDLNVPAFSSNVASIDVHPSWNGNPAFDLAMITLIEPITDLTPARITDQNPNGLLATMVGYGRQGTGANHPSNVPGANDKLGAQNMIDWVTTTVRTDFDSPTGSHNTYGSPDAITLEGTTAGGDSGGPVLAHFGDESLIVGVLNGGWNPYGWDSEYGDISEWAYIGNAANLAFLATHGVVPWIGFDDADFDEDGDVDGDDFLTWQVSFGKNADGDADGDGDTDGDDFLVWQSQFETTGGKRCRRAGTERGRRSSFVGLSRDNSYARAFAQARLNALRKFAAQNCDRRAPENHAIMLHARHARRLLAPTPDTQSSRACPSVRPNRAPGNNGRIP